VHISMMSAKFIKDPREVVKAGDVVKVKVLEVDAARKRIALTMRLDDSAQRAADQRAGELRGPRNDHTDRSGRNDRTQKPRAPAPRPEAAPSVGSGLMADALARAMKGGK